MKPCNHGRGRGLIEIRCESFPSKDDPERAQVALVCTKCRILKTGLESGSGRFTLESIAPIAPHRMAELMRAVGGHLRLVGKSEAVRRARS